MRAPNTPRVSRREFLADAGLLVVGFTLIPRLARAESLGSGANGSAAPPADQLDSWLVVGRDERVTVYAGKVELGTGVSTALRQIVAEELDVPLDRITWVQGDSARSVDQGRTVGSGSVKRGGAQLRRAAAEARQALLEMASVKLGTPVDRLSVSAGVIAVSGAAAKQVSFGELIGDGRFERTISGNAPVKPPNAYRVVGQPIPRVEIPAKATGTHEYVHDVRLPGMLHGRVVRPPRVGATLVSLDERSIAGIPGARVVRTGTFVGVVAEREEDAIRAAKALTVKWNTTPVLPDASQLYEQFKAQATTARPVAETGNADDTLRAASRLVRARYTWPFQMHASIGPSCAVADVKDRKATVWSSTQGAHQLCAPIAALLRLNADDVRVIFTEGSGCYGHNGADDVAADAALMSQAVGRPVRVQWSRADEHGWEPEGPAMLFEMAGAVGADGRISAWTYDAWTPTHGSRPTRDPATLIAGMLAGVGTPARPFTGGGGGERNAQTNYRLPNERVTSHPVPSFPIRTSSLRGLGSPQNSFANESFMDELAAAAGADPVEFRRRHLTDPRAIAVLDAAARRANWQPRQPRPASSSRATAPDGAPLMGRGVAYVQYDRTEAYVAAVVDAEVRPDTGVVRVRRVCVAHDCGLIVNPDGLRNQIEGNVVQAISRTLKEAVRFDATRVTGLDWNGYPILRFTEIPDAIDIELIDQPNEPSVGAGEAATSPVPAAIANAVFDATGVRLRDVPITAQRVKERLNGAKG
jgi:CO/xanthine dehydrogenase Mo-binding subunit